MDIRPPRKIIIQRRGKTWLIFHFRYISDSLGGWKLVDELIRGPVGYPCKNNPETESKALQAARKECIKYGIVTEPEIRE